MHAIGHALRWMLDTLGGCIELVRLGIITGFRMRGPYWTWRTQTAFGRGWPKTKGEQLASILEYARWVRRMRRQM